MVTICCTPVASWGAGEGPGGWLAALVPTLVAVAAWLIARHDNVMTTRTAEKNLLWPPPTSMTQYNNHYAGDVALSIAREIPGFKLIAT